MIRKKCIHGFKANIITGNPPHEKYDCREIVEVCENCPFPDCIDKHGKGCSLIRDKLKELRGKKNEKRCKATN